MAAAGSTATLLTRDQPRRRHDMAIRESVGLDGSARTAARTEPAPGRSITTGAAKFLAVFRVVLGFEFL
jgi:hypothetical protein